MAVEQKAIERAPPMHQIVHIIVFCRGPSSSKGTPRLIFRPDVLPQDSPANLAKEL
jgi:hypothetical protein